jgi:hypothetical protein
MAAANDTYDDPESGIAAASWLDSGGIQSRVQA